MKILDGRLARLERRTAPPAFAFRWAAWNHPGEPRPEAGPGEHLFVRRFVAPDQEHDPDDPTCNCRSCWAEAGVGDE